MQDNDYIINEIDKNKDSFYTSKELNGIILVDNESNVNSARIHGNFGIYDSSVLAFSKTNKKTNIKLLIKKNVLTEIILCDITKIEVLSDKFKKLDIFISNKNLIKSKAYLNSNNYVEIKLKLLNESEKKNEF